MAPPYNQNVGVRRLLQRPDFTTPASNLPNPESGCISGRCWKSIRKVL